MPFPDVPRSHGSKPPPRSVQTSPRSAGSSWWVFSMISPLSRSSTAQNVCPSGPMWTFAAQSITRSPKAPT